MNKKCRICKQVFEITAQDRTFLEKLSPVIAGIRYDIPPPTLCPQCRQLRRLSFRNERSLYHGKSAASGKQHITMFAPEWGYKSYLHDEYFGDTWSGLDYGREFNFNAPFFPQFGTLLKDIPHLALTTSVDAHENNCRYVNFAGHNRNAHMIFDSDFVEDSYYSNVLKHSKNCMDCTFVDKSELCYECIDCTNCFALFYSQNSSNCSESYFLKNCIGCASCFMCCNLTRKQYCIKNKQYSREEYLVQLASYQLGSRSSVENLVAEFNSYIKNFPKKYSHSIKTENCIGDYISNSKSCSYCFNISAGEDLRFCDSLYHGARDCMDVSSFGEGIERVYESGTIGVHAYNVLFSFIIVVGSSDLIYCIGCRSCRNCFGCAELRHKEYCILNRQYSKEEYEELLPKILQYMTRTGEWGEYFPPTLSFFAYNETIAHEYYPLAKEEALALGYKWKEVDEKSYKPATFTLPDQINDVAESVCDELLVCAECRRNYKIIAQELKFYSKLGIPVPISCNTCRHTRRMQMRNPMCLWERSCAKCGAEFHSSYSPARLEALYCERCYEEEIA